MSDQCLPQLQACRMRVTLLDSNGVPHPGASSVYVTKSFTEVGAAAVYTDGDEIEDKNACGEVEVNYKASDSFKRLDLTITLLTPDPFLSQLLSGGVVLTDGDAKGFAYPGIGVAPTQLVSIEVWAKRIKNGALDPDFPYAWWVFPQVQNLRIGDKTLNAQTQNAVFTGQAVENANWFDGPSNDWPVASDRVAQWIPTTTLPDVSCGYVALAAS